MKRAASVLICAVLCFLLVSCGENKTVLMDYNEEGLLVSDKASYKYAPVGYEPTNQGEEYGAIESGLKEKLYRIGDLDPEEWLTTEYTGASTTVYYSEDIELPTLRELSPKLLYICEQGDNANIYSVYTLGDSANGKVDSEREKIDKIVSMLYDESVESELWPRGEQSESYSLKLYSEDWPAIYYNLVYVREGENNYVYDRVEKRCINIGTLLEGYIENTDK